MKSAYKLFLFLFLAAALPTQAQITEGKIIYDITYPGSTFDSVTVKNLPSECAAFFNEDKLRMDIALGLGMSNTILVDNVKQEVHVLTDMAGNKTDFVIRPKEKPEKTDYKIELKDERRIIAGYECRKAVATDKNGNSYTVWYTNQIKTHNANWNTQFREIDGFLMEFTINQTSLTMNMTVRSLHPEKVNPDIFKVPDGYQLLTEDDLKRMGRGK
jgi:hypothetical protein